MGINIYDFIRERVQENWITIMDADSSPWDSTYSQAHGYYGLKEIFNRQGKGVIYAESNGAVNFLKAFDPSRVLTIIEVIEELTKREESDRWTDVFSTSSPSETIKGFAYIWNDHPDWDESWKPEFLGE